jgi:hypothetical protein
MAWTVYWWPEGAGSWKSITLPLISTVEDRTYRDVIDAVGAVMTRLDRGSGRQIRITSRINRINDETTWLQLLSLDSYLRGGGRISLGQSDAMYLAFATTSIVAGQTAITTGGNVLPYDTPSLSSGDYLRLERYGPDLVDVAKLSAIVAGKSITLAAGLQQDLGSLVAVRPYRTFPVLYMPAEKAADDERWLADERHPGLIYDLDLLLEERPAEVFALYESGKSLASSSQRLGQGVVSLNRAIEATGGTVRKLGARSGKGAGGRWQ